MPILNRDGHITDPDSPNGAVFKGNIIKNSEKLNITFEAALEYPQDSFDWIRSFKSNLAFSKGTDQNWSTKLAKFYFDQLNRRVDRPDKNFNSLTHDYDKLFVKDDKFLFLDKLSPLIQNLVYKGGDKEKNPILVIENQNPLIQNYIKIARENLGIEGLGNEESLDSSGSSANDVRVINETFKIARKKIKLLTDFSKGHYDLDKIDIDKELKEIKSFLEDNKDHLGDPTSPSSKNRDPQSPSYLNSTLSSKNRDPQSPSYLNSTLSSKNREYQSPSYLKPRIVSSPLRKSKTVDLRNLLNELNIKYKNTIASLNKAESFAKSEKTVRFQLPKDSASEGELLAESETPRAQSPEGLPSPSPASEGELLAESETPRAQSHEDSAYIKKLFADPETPRAQSPEANKLFAEPETPRAQSHEDSAHIEKLFLEPETQRAQSPKGLPSTSPSPKGLILSKLFKTGQSLP